MQKVGFVLYAPSQLNSFVKSDVLHGLKKNHKVELISTKTQIVERLLDEHLEPANLAHIPMLVRKLSSFVQMVSLWKFKDRSMNHLVRSMASFGSTKQQKAWTCVVVNEMKIPLWERYAVRFMSLPIFFDILRLVEHLIMEIFLVNRLRAVLQNFSLILIPFSGHIGADFGNLVWLAKRLEIPVVALQENWDNLSTKTFILEEPDYFLVWGAQSAGHVRSIHRLFNVEVAIVGSPRFSPYFQGNGNTPTVSMEDGSKVSLRERQFILVAGTGDGIDDEMLVELVSDTLSLDNIRGMIPEDFGIVYRPHPMTRTEVNYSRLHQAFGNLYIDNGPDSRVFGHHNSLVKGASMVVNHFSTLTLESLMCGTPVMCPLFLGRPEARYRYENLLTEWHHTMGLALVSSIKFPRSAEEFMEQICDVVIKGSIEVQSDVNLDWFCRRTDYESQISDFIDMIIKTTPS